MVVADLASEDIANNNILAAPNNEPLRTDNVCELYLGFFIYLLNACK